MAAIFTRKNLLITVVHDKGSKAVWHAEPIIAMSRQHSLPVQVYATVSASRDAISASGALNRPRLSIGGNTASIASSFSAGSIRR